MFIRKAKYEDLKYELGKIKENRRYWEEQFQLMKENKESLEVNEIGTIIAQKPFFFSNQYASSMNKVYESIDPFCTFGIDFDVW